MFLRWETYTMLHKAFCFDTKSFNKELALIITRSASEANTDELYAFIENKSDRITSPYTEEPIGEDWINELEEVEIQALSDFALTYYYNICEDIGLEYSWDALSEYLKFMSIKHEASYYVLGETFHANGFRLDPGGMGMGFIQAESISDIKKELIVLNKTFNEIIINREIDTLYSLSKHELKDAYLSLVAIYEQAEREMAGLMFTF
jgi:hypothetical protein